MNDRIDLIDSELRSLTDQVMERTRIQPFGLYVFASDAPGADLARHIERAVFEETFGNSPELVAAEYGPYEAASMFLCVIDHRRRRPAGMLRVLRPAPSGVSGVSGVSGPSGVSGASGLTGFKSLHDIDRVWGQSPEYLARHGVTLRADRLWDIATLAVDSDYRGRAAHGLVGLSLYQALHMGTRRYGIEQLVTILDVRVLRLLQWQLVKPFIEFAGMTARRYLDSAASLPVWSDLGAWADRLATADPAMHDLMFDGRGLEGAVDPPDWTELDRRTVQSVCWH
jgi:hypothetical protein